MKLLALFFLFTGKAHASLLVEPYAGYVASNVTLQDTFTDGFIGGRVGVGVGSLTIGIDYMHGRNLGKFTPERSYLLDYAKGFYANISLILFRVWGSYYFEANYLKPNNDFSKGKGIAIGLGFYPIPVIDVSVNLEYRKISPEINEKELTEYGVSISIPLHF